MSENKTKPTEKSVDVYIDSIGDTQQRTDSRTLIELLQSETGEIPKLWGPSIVGFGSYHYRYESGREGDSPKVGFSARKQALTLYGLTFDEPMHKNNLLLDSLGTHTRGKGCIYIKELSDINIETLRAMIRNTYMTK